jgi:hypothetical protein
MVNLAQKHSGLATGVVIFAAAMLMFSGLSQALWGIAALINDEFLVRVGGYIYAFDSTTWGWIHLILGAGFVAVGIFILTGRSWAYVIGIILAVLNAVLNFLWLPLSPLAALVFIAINVLIVWALATARKD